MICTFAKQSCKNINNFKCFFKICVLQRHTNINMNTLIADKRFERMMKKSTGKFIDRSKNKFFDNNENSMNEYNPISNFSKRLPKASNSLKARQLASVYKNHITSIIYSGQVCPGLIDLGFEISNIQMSTDLQTILISWHCIADRDSNLDKIKSILSSSVGELRSYMLSMRVTSHLPYLLFCEDQTLFKLAQVEKLISVADMGPKEDYAPENSNLINEEQSEKEIFQKFEETKQLFSKTDNNQISTEKE